MAAESNTGFHYDGMILSAMNRHTTSFQSGAINSNSEIVPVENYYGMNYNSPSMNFSRNSNTLSNSGTSQPGSSSGSHPFDYGSESKQETGLAVEWSYGEQFKLEEGLAKFAGEPNIMKYIKIAATLQDKTVRDVAMRCRWMTRKRRKLEEHNVGKKATNRKDKQVESSSNTNLTPDPSSNLAAYSLMMNNMDQNKYMTFEELNGTAKHLLTQNAQVFNQINANLSTLKLQDNIDLFSCTRNNLTAILNDMSDMQGMMGRMPPLPVNINEDLANFVLSNAPKPQPLLFGSQRGFQPKEEPRC